MLYTTLNMQSFGHKTFILSQPYLSFCSKKLFYKICLSRCTYKRNAIQTTKYTVIWSQNVHFVTTLQILINKLFFQNVFSQLYLERKCYPNQLICSYFVKHYCSTFCFPHSKLCIPHSNLIHIFHHKVIICGKLLKCGNPASTKEFNLEIC